jgi:CCR4-NOT transcription complex subunit 1
MLSVIADQLRFPSAHTLFFISFLLHLFSTSNSSPPPLPTNTNSNTNGSSTEEIENSDRDNQDQTQTQTRSGLPERISRVLLERVIVHKPHPWGLLVAFIELLENEEYGFWKQPFIRAEEEIFMLFVRAQRGMPGGGNAIRA